MEFVGKATKSALAGQNILGALATGSARAHPPGGKTGGCCGAGRFRKAPPSESGEGEDDDREQEQETEREARDCEQAVWNAVNEHGIAPVCQDGWPQERPAINETGLF